MPLTKQEAADRLNCKVRTLELYTQQGKLSVTYARGARGRVAQYDESEVDALKHELDSGIQKPSVALQSASLANPIASNEAMQTFALALRASLPPVLINGKMSLSFDEACEVSGYSKAAIRRAMNDNRLPYSTDGPRRSIRIKCADLQRWVESL